MARAKDEPRSALGALQEILTEGSQVLIGQALSLGEGVQRRLVEAGRGVEEQLSQLVTTLETQLGQRLDTMLDALAVSLRRDLDRMRERLVRLESRATENPAETIRAVVGPIQAQATTATERAAAAVARCEELLARVQNVERRAETPVAGTDDEEARRRLDRMDQRLTDLGREVGTKLGELSALRERLTRLETRVVEHSKDQIARAGESAGLRDRLTRLESRLSDLSKEQLARAVETAGLRERLFRMEQRGGTPATAAALPAATESLSR